MKPPILSEFKIMFLGREVIIQEETIRTTPLMLAGMAAQNDADAAYYEQRIREIFEEIESYCKSGQCWVKTDSPFNWQSLKSKYTGVKEAQC
jgi:hypothetical protein